MQLTLFLLWWLVSFFIILSFYYLFDSVSSRIFWFHFVVLACGLEMALYILDLEVAHYISLVTLYSLFLMLLWNLSSHFHPWFLPFAILICLSSPLVWKDWLFGQGFVADVQFHFLMQCLCCGLCGFLGLIPSCCQSPVSALIIWVSYFAICCLCILNGLCLT